MIEDAELEACELVENALWDKCVNGKHFGSIVFWLLNRSQGRWQDTRNINVNHTGTPPYSPAEQQATMGDPILLKAALIESIPDAPETRDDE